VIIPIISNSRIVIDLVSSAQIYHVLNMHIIPPIGFQCRVSSEATEIGEIHVRGITTGDVVIRTYRNPAVEHISPSTFARASARGKKQRLPENEERASVISRDSERGWICPEHFWCIDSILLE